jgi:hypothetical protein
LPAAARGYFEEIFRVQVAAGQFAQQQGSGIADGRCPLSGTVGQSAIKRLERPLRLAKTHDLSAL